MLYQLMSNHPSRRTSTKQHATRQASKKGLCNILENENGWTIELLVPGYAKSDFSMDVKDDVLKVSASPTSNSKESNDKKFIKKEFSVNKIERSFTLPKNATPENITAKLEAGILNIVIPKSEDAKPKTINIK